MCIQAYRNITSNTQRDGDPRKEILRRISIILDENPQMRFGQIISNIFRPIQYSGNPRFDCYYVPDSAVIEYIKNFEDMLDYLKKKDGQG